MKTTTPYKDKNLTNNRWDGEEISEIELVTDGHYEECKIVQLKIKTIGGKTVCFKYWNEYNKREQIK